MLATLLLARHRGDGDGDGRRRGGGPRLSISVHVAGPREQDILFRIFYEIVLGNINSWPDLEKGFGILHLVP